MIFASDTGDRRKRKGGVGYGQIKGTDKDVARNRPRLRYLLLDLHQ